MTTYDEQFEKLFSLIPMDDASTARMLLMTKVIDDEDEKPEQFLDLLMEYGDDETFVTAVFEQRKPHLFKMAQELFEDGYEKDLSVEKTEYHELETKSKAVAKNVDILKSFTIRGDDFIIQDVAIADLEWGIIKEDKTSANLPVLIRIPRK